MKKLQLFTVLFLLGFQVFAQNFKGQILSEETQQPIPFVNMAVVDNYQGTASDENGFFDFSLEKIEPTVLLRISAIGFVQQEVSIQELIKICEEKEGKIYLKTAKNELPEVTIRSKKLKKKKVGLHTQSPAFQNSFTIGDKQLGWEYGTRIKIKQPSLLKKIGVNAHYCSHDTMFYQVNIYQMDGDKVGENILPKPVYIKFIKKNIKKSVYVDIDHLNLEVKADVLVTLEAVKVPKNEKYQLVMNASFRYDAYSRSSLGDWSVNTYGSAIFAVIEYE